MNITFDMLNDNQRDAVEWGDGPLLVLAGPGSGKTAVLTLRIANLIQNTPEESFRILGLTFTVNAANEMRSRIVELLGQNTRRIQLKTFHAFCADVLRQHGSHLGLQPDFSVLTDDKDRLAVLEQLDNDEVDIEEPEDVLKKIDAMFTHGITPERLSEYFDTDQHEQLHVLKAVFEAYTKRLVQENQLDFGSMLYFTTELLNRRPRIAKQIRTTYRYICVDEFHDTNLAQYKVLRLLAPDSAANLFIVADDDQIIFQWNGADPKRLQELKDDYNPAIIQLPVNFRCPEKIVEIANKLISFNPNRLSSKPSVSNKSKDGNVTFEQFEDFDAEITGLISKIEPVPKNRRETCLVIARSNKLLVQVQQAMNMHDVKAEIVSRTQDFTCPLILLIYYSLKLANSPDSRSILNKLSSAATLINGMLLSSEEVVAKARVEDSTLLRAFFTLAASSRDLEDFCKMGQALLCDSLDYKKFIQQALETFDSLTNTDEECAYPDYAGDKANWQRISDNIDHSQGEVSLHVFLQEMDLSPKAKTLSKDCVRLQTVHTSKGVEFDNVYVIGLAEEQFPTFYAIRNGDRAIQEERRNCFVAITRSSRNLYLSYAHEYFGWRKEPSRFLREMGIIENK